MSMKRRDFLKLAGFSAVLGAGGAAVIRGDVLEAALFKSGEEALKAERWVMTIDVSRFGSVFDYKRIVDACHEAHNVPEFPPNLKNHEIKWIWKDSFEHTFPGSGHKHMPGWIEEKPFVLLCNHCENPPCVRVCPTQATFKRKEDGIVIMDFHRCIGCRFCMAACPFGARSFNWQDPRAYIKKENREFPTRTKGVVEKCNFCAERLAVGKKPACVEASNGAMVFGDLSDPNSEVRGILRTHYTIVRKPELGTQPGIFYVIARLGGSEPAEDTGGEEHV